MGKRVHVQSLANYVQRIEEELRVRPGFVGMMATLSCGHRRAVTWLYSVNDPVWCSECEGAPCLACGALSTGLHAPSFEWGESCAAHVDLEETEWERCVRLRRQGVDARPFAAMADCARCGEPAMPFTGFCSRFCREAHEVDEASRRRLHELGYREGPRTRKVN
jgi:hypothetical protein